MPIDKFVWLKSLLLAACFALMLPLWSYQLLLQVQSTSSAVTTAAPQQNPGTLIYALTWDGDGVMFDAEGAGWWVQTGLGYEVHVEQGYVVTGNLELVPCAHEHETLQSQAMQAASPVLHAFSSVAYAGHGDQADGSQLAQPLVESLTAPTDVALAANFGVEPVYCQAHYLAAYAPEGATNLPALPEMVGRTLYIAGTWRTLDTEAPVPFTIQSDLAWGTLLALESHSPTGTGREWANTIDVQVTIQRNLGQLFENVDFATMGEAEMAVAVLRSLTSSATATVTMSEVEGVLYE